MATFYQKQHASRVNDSKIQVLAYAGGGSSVPSTTFSPQTFQIRVCSEVQGWLAFGTSSVSATAQSASIKIPPNVPEYFEVMPNSAVAFNSTSTSTGMVSVAEMC